MKQFIDIRACCQDGLSLVWDKWKAWESSDHRALMKLRKLESDHLSKCTVCNPELLVAQLWENVKITNG